VSGTLVEVESLRPIPLPTIWPITPKRSIADKVAYDGIPKRVVPWKTSVTIPNINIEIGIKFTNPAVIDLTNDTAPTDGVLPYLEYMP